MANSCAEPVTVTVTQTILQGAATSTTNAASSLLTSSEPGVTPSDASIQNSSSDPSSTADNQASSIAFGLLAVISDTTLTTMAPPTTLTLNLVNATPSSRDGTSTNASSTSSECPKPTASKAARSGAVKPSTPPGTIAGGVIGSVAGLGLLLALLLWCCKRKRKITFKRKVQKADPDDQSLELEAVRQKEDDAVRQFEQVRKDKPLPSPRSFDFGLPKITHSTSPVMPQRRI